MSRITLGGQPKTPRFGLALAAALLTLGPTWTTARGQDMPAAPRHIESLAPGAVVERRLARGAVDVFRLPMADRPQMLTVEQRGVDLVVDVEADDGTNLASVQSPGEDRGLETVLIPGASHTSPARWLTVRIEAASRGEPPGPYRLWVEQLATRDAIAAATRAPRDRSAFSRRQRP